MPISQISQNDIDKIRNKAKTDKEAAKPMILELFYNLHAKTNPDNLLPDDKYSAYQVKNGQVTKVSIIPKNENTILVFNVTNEISEQLKSDLKAIK